MTKVKILGRSFKTVAKYLYRSELHGDDFEVFQKDLEKCFEFVDELPKRRPMRLRRKKTYITPRKRHHLPPPIPVQAMVNKYAGITVHRCTETLRTLCGTLGAEVVRTLDDSKVNCHNCLLPKHQAKLGKKSTQDEDEKIGEYHPPHGLPEIPHFLSSNSSET